MRPRGHRTPTSVPSPFLLPFLLVFVVLEPKVLGADDRVPPASSYTENSDLIFPCDTSHFREYNLVAGDRPYRHRSTKPGPGLYFDARGAVWRLTPDSNHQSPHPIAISSSADMCWNGGIVLGEAPSEWPHGAYEIRNANPAGMRIATGGSRKNVLISELIIHKLARGIQILNQVNSVYMHKIWISRVLNHCIETTSARQVMIQDSLFEDCRNVYSEDDQRIRPGTVSQISIENSLFSFSVFADPTNSRELVGRRMTNEKPSITLRRSILLVRDKWQAEEINIAGVSLQEIVECSDNVIVWIGHGQYPGQLSDCFTVTKDKRVWDRVRNAWIKKRAIVEGQNSPVVATIKVIAESGSEESDVESIGDVESDSGKDRESMISDQGEAGLQLFTLSGSGERQREVQRITGFYWSDGTGWVDHRGTLVACRNTAPGVLRPMTASAPCRS